MYGDKMQMYNIVFNHKGVLYASGFAPMSFKEALILRPKCMRYKHRSIEIRKV